MQMSKHQKKHAERGEERRGEVAALLGIGTKSLWESCRPKPGLI